MWHRLIPLLLLSCFLAFTVPGAQAQESDLRSYTIKPGDTWTALALRFDLPPDELIAAAGTINTQRQPAIGSRILLPTVRDKNGRIIRPFAGGILHTAAQFGESPWGLALQNGHRSPYDPLLYTPLYLQSGQGVPRELPAGFRSFSLSPQAGLPGQALLLQALVEGESEPEIWLGQDPWLTGRNGDHLLALTATGAFFAAKQVDLNITIPGVPLWSQPWQFEDRDWNYEQIDFAAMPATDPEIMRLERERLQEIWSQVTPAPLWQGSFQWPLEEYVELTSHYGARRSINGGAYDTYHEGTDFSAYGGTPVYAPAGGKVVIAEPLQVRGGTVILDHGLGIHSGYYHLSYIAVTSGQMVQQGDLVGEVGSTGRSTGNHLHWDMLIGTTWVDAERWMAENLAVHIHNAWGAGISAADRLDMPPRS